MRMIFVSSFSGLPNNYSKDPRASLEPVLEELRLFPDRNQRVFGQSVEITCDFSSTKFELDNLQHLCDWLNEKKVHALDLMSNVIFCSELSQLEPLLLKLREQVR